jgi:nitrogenase molybdenum-iron protein alpha/beta subunit
VLVFLVFVKQIICVRVKTFRIHGGHHEGHKNISSSLMRHTLKKSEIAKNKQNREKENQPKNNPLQTRVNFTSLILKSIPKPFHPFIHSYSMYYRSQAYFVIALT